MGAFSYLHSGTPISPAATQLMDTRALPSLSNISNTNGLHQIFWELGHLRVEKESWGLRADRLPIGSTLSSSPGSTLEVPAKSLPLSQKRSAHTPNPSGALFCSPNSQGIFQSKYISLSERNSGANFNKITFLSFIAYDAPNFITIFFFFTVRAASSVRIDSRRFPCILELGKA